MLFQNIIKRLNSLLASSLPTVLQLRTQVPLSGEKNMGTSLTVLVWLNE